jgi:hypothetical protein
VDDMKEECGEDDLPPPQRDLKRSMSGAEVFITSALGWVTVRLTKARRKSSVGCWEDHLPRILSYNDRPTSRIRSATRRVLAGRLGPGLAIVGVAEARRRLELEPGGLVMLPFDRATPAGRRVRRRHPRPDLVALSGGDPVWRCTGMTLRPRTSPGRLSRHDGGSLATMAVAGRRDDTDRPHLAAPVAVPGRGRLARERPAAHIFRLAGFYGPGRNPWSTSRAGTARRSSSPGQVFSRSHVRGYRHVLMPRSRGRGRPLLQCRRRRARPAAGKDVVAHARLMGIAPPPEQAYETADYRPWRGLIPDNRRVRIDRIMEEWASDGLPDLSGRAFGVVGERRCGGNDFPTPLGTLCGVLSRGTTAK